MARLIGHADTSHAAEQSSEFAKARTQSVRQALIVAGVADTALSVVGHGANDLAGPTPDGVREPLNRRVELVVVCD